MHKITDFNIFIVDKIYIVDNCMKTLINLKKKFIRDDSK